MRRFLNGALLLAALFGLFSPAWGQGTTPLPSLSGIQGGGSVELGQQVVLEVIFFGSSTATGLSYQWRKAGVDIPGATAIRYTIAAAAPSDAATYAIAVSNGVSSSVATTSVTVRAAAPPVITTQPRTIVAEVGQTTGFTIGATGSFPRTYQWRKDGANIADGTAITLTLTNITTNDAGTYTVTVSNAQGTVTSSAASLTVNAAVPPAISSFSPSDITYTHGQSATLSVSMNSGTSPFTYRWMKAGVEIAGATGSQLAFPVITPGDSGRYSVRVSNAAGSVNSREALVTVNPASPIVISRSPASLTRAEGQSADFSVSIDSGSSPYTYRWSKDGTVITGATFSNYSISSLTMAHAGSYVVAISNVLGSVTSAAAILTVTAPLPPTITSHPAAQTVSFGGSFSFSVQVTGTPPFTYQWRLNGTPVTNGTSSGYSLSNATPAHSGAYTVVVSNAVGSVTSNAATITVPAATAPTISRHPSAVEAPVGSNASFSISISTSSGVGSLTYQWLKDGAPIPGATSSSYSISPLRDTHTGLYSVLVTGVGGSVTSNTARLTVLPPAPPTIRFGITSTTYVTLGESNSLSVNSIEGTSPFTYQWAKDGVAIPDATTATLRFTNVRASDLATYTLTISNEGGVFTTPGMRVQVQPPSPFSNSSSNPPPWVDIARMGDTVYILATLPARIERYDLAGERWLPSVNLSETQVPTAFAVAEEGIYIAYGRALARRPLDLSTETAIANAPTNVTHMFVFESLLYFNAASTSSSTRGYSTINRSTLQPGVSAAAGRFSDTSYRQLSIAPSLRKAFARSTGYSPADIETFTFAADGSVANGSTDSPYHGTMPVGLRTFVLPGDQLVADDSGTVYRTTDLTYAGSFGEAFTDLTFMADGTPIILRSHLLTMNRVDNFIETGRTTIASGGLRVFARGANVFVVGVGATAGSFAATKVAASSFAPAAPPTPTALPSGRYSVDDAFVGADNVVYIFSRTLQGFARWSATTRSFLPTAPLRSAPGSLFHQAGNSRVLIHYPDGIVTEFPLRSGAAERTLVNIGHYVRAMVDLGDMFTLNISDSQSSGDNRLIVPSGGPRLISTNLYNASGLAWQAGPRRLYSAGTFSSGSLQAETITAAGTLVTGTANILTSTVTANPPIRFNPEGTLLATGNGRVLNADLAQVGVLANNIADAAWLPTGLYTVRSVAGQSEVQQWSRITYLQAGSVTVRGTPVRLLRLSDTQLLVVSSVQGFLTLTLVDSDLTPRAPPDVAQFAGVYLAKLGPAANAGDLALYLRANGTGTLLAHLSGSRAALLSTNVAINADGSFVVSVPDLATGISRTVAGSIGADGALSGSIPNLNLTFTGGRVSGGGVAGYYRAPAVNGGVGTAYAIVAPDGRSVVVAQNASSVEGGMVSGNAAGQYPLTTSSGAQLTFVIDAGSGRMMASANRDAFAGISFAGLRDDVPRTDRLANISTRGRAGAGEDAMIAGFVITGNGPRAVMVRAIGPALTNFGIAGALSDPQLILFRGGTAVAQSDNWSAEASAAPIAQAATRLGAFTLPSPGRDAVVLATLEPGGYTAQVTAATGDGGVALVEVYDAGTEVQGGTPKLVNIATRGRVGVGEDVLIAGIVVSGNAPKRLLVRAIGPTLGTFGVAGSLADPVLTILAGSRTLATNDDWGNSGTTSGSTAGDISAAAVSVGAFALAANSRDASIIITLEPGSYTAQVSGKGTATGIALVEVYEVSN
ncbi:MAG: immunoglobulin domain-containing protein [Verrucomicrobiota bacterium]